jgi:hypothetical protein
MASGKLYRKFNNPKKVKEATGVGTCVKAHWLKGKEFPEGYHYQQFRGRWHLLKGDIIVARQPPAPQGEDYEFDFATFERFCRPFFEETKRKWRRKKRSIENELQFFTAYWWMKDWEEDDSE